MLWRIWTLLVSVLRWMTPRPGFLLPMAVKGAAAGERGKNGIAGPNGSYWKEQKAEFLRNPSLRQSKQFQQQRQKQRQKDQQQQHRRKFFDFGFGFRSPSPLPSPHSPSPNEKGKGNAKPSNIYGKWRKRQPSTNAFVFVTPPLPPPTVTVQDFSNVPLPLSLVASTPDVEGALPPARPPRPPSGPVPTVVVTPSAPMVHVTDFGVAGGGPGTSGVQSQHQAQSRPSTRDSRDREPQHYRSSSGRHLSPEWLSQSPPPSSPATSSLTLALPSASESVAGGHDGHARKSSVSPHSPGTGVGGHPNRAPARTNFSKPIPSSLAASTAHRESVSESDFGYETPPRGRESPLVFASSRFSVSSPSTPASSRPTSFTGVQYHQDLSVSWDHSKNAGPTRQTAAPPLPLPHSSSDPIDSYVNFNSRAEPYTTSTPTKDGRTFGDGDGRSDKIGLGIHDPEDTSANVTFLSTVSEAGSFTTPPRSEAPASRRVHLPEDDLDLLPYPEVFDLDMYFSNWRSSYHDHDQTQTSRLSLCVLRNAKAEDIQRMQILAQRQELQSRQNESVKDFTSFSPSPPPLHGYLGLIAADSVSEMNVPLGGSGTRGDDEHLFREKENRAPASARAQWSLRTKRVGHLEGESMLGPTSHSRNHARSRSLATSFGSQIHENEGAAGRQVEGEVRRDAYRPAASRPILRQVGNTVSSTAASETNSRKGSSLANPGSDIRPSIPTTSTSPASSATRSSLTSRVLIPPVPAPPVHAQLPSSSSSSKNPRPPLPHLQIIVPGLSQRVINRKKESELSPIKEAFHPPSLAILTPPPPSPTSPHSCPLTDSAHEEHPQGRRPRPPTLPIVIVSHHRFGSISDYGDGNDTDLEDHEGLYYRQHSESSEDEDDKEDGGGGGPRHSYDSGGLKSRIPGHSQNGRRRESRQTRSRWSTSSLAYMDEEHGGLEVVSLS